MIIVKNDNKFLFNLRFTNDIYYFITGFLIHRISRRPQLIYSSVVDCLKLITKFLKKIGFAFIINIDPQKRLFCIIQQISYGSRFAKTGRRFDYGQFILQNGIQFFRQPFGKEKPIGIISFYNSHLPSRFLPEQIRMFQGFVSHHQIIHCILCTQVMK